MLCSMRLSLLLGTLLLVGGCRGSASLPPTTEKAILIPIAVEAAPELPPSSPLPTPSTLSPQPDGSVRYRNAQMGFTMTLPPEWSTAEAIPVTFKTNTRDEIADTGIVIHIPLLDGKYPAPTNDTDRSMLEKIRYPSGTPATLSPLIVIRAVPRSPGGLPEVAQNDRYWFLVSDISVRDNSVTKQQEQVILSFYTDTEPPSAQTLTYHNAEYGFELTIPAYWSDYRIDMTKETLVEDKPPGAERYPADVGFRFHVPYLDKQMERYGGEPLFDLVCIDRKKWDEATEPYYRNYEGPSLIGYVTVQKNTKCVFIAIPSQVPGDGPARMRMGAVMDSLQAIPPENPAVSERQDPVHVPISDSPNR